MRSCFSKKSILLVIALYCVVRFLASDRHHAGHDLTHREERSSALFLNECTGQVYKDAVHIDEPFACWCSCSAVPREKMGTFNKREFASCPDGSVERHRFLCHLLATKSYSKLSRVLFVAPDPSAFDFITNAFPHADVIGGYKYIAGSFVPNTTHPMFDVDLTSMPFPNNFFDIVIVQHVLEHIEDDMQALREISRIIRSGGQALLEVPINAPGHETIEHLAGVSTASDRLQAYGQRDHVRRYSSDFYDRVRAAGFDVNVIQYKDHFKRHLPFEMPFQNKEILSATSMCIAEKL